MSNKISKMIDEDEEWKKLIGPISDDLDASAKEYGALLRKRGIESGVSLLRVNLTYATTLSLRITATWAACMGLCNITRQAVSKRINNSTAWLCHLVSVLLTKLCGMPQEFGDSIHRLILADSSTIARPGSPGTEWRLHLAWQPFKQQPAEIMLTDAKQREGLEQMGLQENDLVVTDRGYALWRNVKVVLAALAYFVFRLTWSNLPLQTLDGQPFDICDWLRSLAEDQEVAEITVAAANDPQKRPLRLIAGRLPPEKAKKARDRVRRQARKKKRKPHPNTLLAAGFCILLTNLPVMLFSALQVLSLYRIRWQVEWCFRRWKSLCELKKLPAYPAEIAEPVLWAKLIIILLMQLRLSSLSWYGWWKNAEPAPVISSLVKLTYLHTCNVIRPPSALTKLLDDLTPFMRHLRSSHRKRPLQLAEIAQQQSELFTQLVSYVNAT